MASILIVEDDDIAAKALAALLRREGHEAVCAADVGSALRALRGDRPDLVVLDLSLPRVDGLSLMDAMRGEAGLGGVPVVVYTGRDDAASVADARALGAADFVVKGGDPHDVAGRIAAALGRHAATGPSDTDRGEGGSSFKAP